MGEAILLYSIQERTADMLLRNNVFKALRAVFSGKGSVGIRHKIKVQKSRTI